jgi:hypothetical protein
MSSGDKETTVDNDPWKNMPAWLKESYQGRTEDGDKIWDDAKGTGPREILDMNATERGAFDDLTGRFGDVNDASKAAWDKTAGLEGGDISDMYGKGAADLRGMMGDGPDFDHGYTGDRMTELLGGKDFGLDYTDNVVDTTLAGMKRKQQQDKLMRQSQQAATGGVSGTRGAVEDAVAGNLGNMSMAQMEASLRDDAQRFGTESLFQQAGALDDSDQFASGQNLTEQGMQADSDQWGLDFGKGLLEGETGALETGMNFDMLNAEQMSGLSDAQLKQAMVQYDMMKGFGAEERGIDTMQANSEQDHLGWLSQMLSGTHLATTNPVGSTQTTVAEGNSAMQNGLGIASSLGGMFMMSDERVKEDVTDIEGSALEKLLALDGPKEYKYKDGFGHVEGRTTGLMAQDLEQAGLAGAVHEIDGIKHVDPYVVTATIVGAVQELARQREAA